ncbi:uncharacterized protein LOC133523947 [Cydia pomonella]|uniref:uncharacterized protein LOC133523947 n=1 Tax=Cydia pomonella TaxID=82600 RepID=UPI002ADDCF99|nr:uncharacterized protein LOC133523947 [Cydia pomonella]
MMCHSRLGAVWVLLAAAAAVDLYELAPEFDNELMYQDSKDIDTGPLRHLRRDDTETTRLNDLLLFRLIKSHLRGLRTDHRIHKDAPTGDIPMLGDSNMAKRFFLSGRPQQRWKSKKGKVIGSQMVCYFKLCAFRNPA